MNRGESRGRGRGGDRGGGRGGRGADRGGGGRGRGVDLPVHGGRGRGRGDFRGRGNPRGRGRGGGGGGFREPAGPPIYSPPDGQIPPPSSEVANIENTTAQNISQKLSKTPGQVRYPERPGFGTHGQPVLLFANYFELSKTDKVLFRYHVDVVDSEAGRQPSGKKVEQVVRLFLEQHFDQIRKSIATDYKSNLISAVDLSSGGTYDVRYRAEDEETFPENPKVFRVKIQPTGTLRPSDLLDYLTSTNASAMFQNKEEILQAMNIVLGHSAKSDRAIASVGANKHYSMHPDSTQRLELGGGLEVLRGFFVSVRAATARLVLNVQVRYAACYEEADLGKAIADFRYDHGQNTYELEKFLSRVRVRVTHLEKKAGKRRIKTIAGLATRSDGSSQDQPPKVPRHGAGPKDVQFFLGDPNSQQQQQPADDKKKGQQKKPGTAGPEAPGKYISVADFFQQQYNISVDPKLPVVNVGNRAAPSYLPAEVAVIEPGQPAGLKLSPNQTRNMLNFAVRSPAQNAASIVSIGTKVLGLGPQKSETLTHFGLESDPRLLTVPGRVLAAPPVYYKGMKSGEKQISPNGASWNMKDIKFSRPARLQSWVWLYIDVKGGRQFWRDQEGFMGTLKNFAMKLNEMGMSTPPPKDGKKIVLTGDNDEEVIDKAIAGMMPHKPELVFTILFNSDVAIYNSVKRVCDVRRGVRNVNVLAPKFAGANDQYHANVGLKVNLKLGGSNQSLKADKLGIIGEGKTMLVGIDVTHPSPGSASSAPSVAGIVASVDPALGQWPADIRIQGSRQEMVSGLDDLLVSRLRVWAEYNKGSYPENIIVYRDGVSEGQYNTVIDEELPLLKKACEATYPATLSKKGLPRISIIIVGKRHQTRFYPTEQKDADKFNNTKNGTVVDRGITEARNWDFFLQAHTALKGTARPAHYFTVWDEIFSTQKPKPPFQNNADVLENLTHNMCYLFGRATKAVSVCPPAYYADLVCERARCYLSGVFDPVAQGGSVSSGSAGGQAAEESDVRIHENVRNVMFYV